MHLFTSAIKILLIFIIISTKVKCFEYRRDLRPYSCGKNEFFDVINSTCIPCDITKNLEPTSNKLSCTCTNESITMGIDENYFPKCIKCESGKIPSSDKRFCIQCSRNLNKNYISVDRYLNGSQMQKCHKILCSKETKPSLNRKQCISCDITRINCTCPKNYDYNEESQSCLPNKLVAEFKENQDVYYIRYERGRVKSQFLYQNLFSAIMKCKLNNKESCQFLCNMCLLKMYDNDHYNDICKITKRNVGNVNLNNTNMQYYMPWVFFNENDDSIKKKISYRGNKLNFILYQWDNYGRFIQILDNLSTLSLCSLNLNNINMASRYKIACIKTINEIRNFTNNHFYELYLKEEINNSTVLHSIPVLNRNYRRINKLINYGDSSQWQLTKRFFLFDSYGSIKVGEFDSVTPPIIRYLKSVTMRIRTSYNKTIGTIFTPMVILSYGEIYENDNKEDSTIKINFNVEFYDYSNIKKTFDILLGITCGIAGLSTFLRTWSRSCRSGQNTIDLVTIFNLFNIACGNLANAFFITTFIISTYSFIYYKGQSTIYELCPTERFDYYVQTYITVAFSLKLYQLLIIIWNQINVDIFLLDWEQPRNKKQSSTVSAWRTYFVANKLNELQGIRRINILFQLIIVVLILKVFGLEYWSYCEQKLRTVPSSTVPFSLVFRFAVGVLTYTSIYIVQYIMVACIYERYIKNQVQEFVDLCSLANISVFILSLSTYGFYIHGRSAHGMSDTDIGTLKNQLHREEEDMVGQRGLLPTSDHQTFQIKIPLHLRTLYTSLLPASTSQDKKKMVNSTKTASNENKIDPTMQSYININRFLGAYFEHALKDIDYEIKDKTFLEILLDIEFQKLNKHGILYKDNGHSFDNIMPYGNELLLFSFELITFAFIEIMTSDFFLSSIITGILSYMIISIRKFGGRKNLARKTLINEHLLI